MKVYTKTVLTLCISGALSATATGVQAQSKQAPGQLEEVVVTASKLGALTTRDVPSTITTFSSSELEARSALTLTDIAGSIPSLQFQDLGPGDKEYVIRGANSSGASLVGVYFDETPITGRNAQDGGGRNIDIPLVDIKRVEVLNGPQGTQYGASSMSGLIRYVTVDPVLDNDHMAGFANLDVSNTDHGSNNATVTGALNVPIIKNKMAIRLVGWHIDNAGWIDQKRAAGGPRHDINSEKTHGGRFRFRYEPVENLTLDLSYLTLNRDVGGSSRYTPKGVTSFGDPASGFPPVVATGQYENTDITQSPWQEHLKIYSGVVKYAFDGIGTVTGTFSRVKRKVDFSFDSSPILFYFGVPIPGQTTQPQNRQYNFGELRFASDLSGPVQFLIGGAMHQEKKNWRSQVVTVDSQGRAQPFVPGIANDAIANPDGTTFFGRYVGKEFNTAALFGEISWDITDWLKLTQGGRYFSSHIKSVEGTSHDFGTAAVLGPFRNNTDQTKRTGKTTLLVQATDDVNFYFTFSQGFRVGGLNNSESLFVNDVPRDFKSDRLNNYELGTKTRFFDGRLTFDATVYHIDWNGLQVETMAGSAFPFIANAGAANIDGLELNLNAVLNDNWSIHTGGSYTDTRITDSAPVSAGIDQISKGDRIPNVPKLKAFLAVMFDVQLPVGELNIRTDVSYQSSSNIMFDTASPYNYKLTSFYMVNVHGNLHMDNGWTAGVYATNLTDDHAPYDAISSDQDPLAVVGARPRTIGMRIRKDF